MKRITQPSKKPLAMEKPWSDYIQDESDKKVIPVGPRFQAEVPDWTGPLKKDILGDKESESESEDSKWLGMQVWPIKDKVVPVGPRFQAEVPDWTGPLKKDILGDNESESESEDSKWLGMQVWPIKDEVVPVGPRFQAEVPDWTGPPKKDIPGDKESGSESEDSKWLGTQVWPIKNEAVKAEIGNGRAEFCLCESPGSVECVRRHVNDERIKLQSELGPAFWEWKFDDMGEEVSNQWTLQEQEMFESIVKMNPLSLGKSFLQPAMAALPSHNRHSILSYYFNVHLIQKIRKETMSGHITADTDDEETSPEATNPRTSHQKKKRRTK